MEAITTGKIDARAWGQATLPLRMGGLGLRDPLTEGPSMRLATLLSSKALALQLGAVPEYVDLQTSAAFTTYQRVLGGCPVAIDVRDKYLQKTLTDNLLQKQLSSLLNGGSSEDRQRLADLVHAACPGMDNWDVTLARSHSLPLPLSSAVHPSHSARAITVHLLGLSRTSGCASLSRCQMHANGGAGARPLCGVSHAAPNRLLFRNHGAHGAAPSQQ